MGPLGQEENMPNRTASIGDTVQVRNARGKTANIVVTGTQANAGSAPSAPAVGNSGTGGTLTAATYSYRISAVKGGAETLASTAGTTVVGAGSTNSCQITLPGVAGTQYAVYGRVGGSELYMGTSLPGAVLFTDTGAVTPAGALPAADNRIAGNGHHSTGAYVGQPGTAPVVKATTVASVNAYFKY
jgi:hypothetical protein